MTIDSVTIDGGGGGFAVIYPAAVVEDLAGKASSGPCPGTEIDRELADEAMLGTSGYLDPGVHRDITVTLDDPIRERRTLAVVPYRDVDGDGTLDSSPKTESSELDAPVAHQEFIVYDTATVAPESTPDRSTAESGATETDTTRTNSTGEHTATVTSADGPGFDATVAVLTLLTGVLLSARLRSGPPDSP